MVKNYTIFIKACPDEYIFKTEEINCEDDEIPQKHCDYPYNHYQYIRVRLIAPNFIGVKKVYESIQKISDVDKNDCKPICQLLHCIKSFKN